MLLLTERLAPVALPALSTRFPAELPADHHRPRHGKIGADWLHYATVAGPRTGVDRAGALAVCHPLHRRPRHGPRRPRRGMVPDFLVAAEIEAGRLTLLDEARLATGEDYFLSIKESRRHEPGLAALARWMRSEAANRRSARRGEADRPPPGKPVPAEPPWQSVLVQCFKQLFDGAFELRIATGCNRVRISRHQRVRRDLEILEELPFLGPKADLGDAEAQPRLDLADCVDRRAVPGTRSPTEGPSASRRK